MTIRRCLGALCLVVGVSAAAAADDCSVKVLEGSWAARYCKVRSDYQDMVVMGRVSASDADFVGGAERRKRVCFEEEASDICVKAKDRGEILANLRRKSLPGMIEQHGQEEGLAFFKRRSKELIDALDFQCREECHKEAVRAYTSRIPELLR
jgi:hypothetical protein